MHVSPNTVWRKQKDVPNPASCRAPSSERQWMRPFDSVLPRQDLWQTILFLEKEMATPVFLSGKSHGQRSLAGYSPWGHKELDITEHTHISPLPAQNISRVWHPGQQISWHLITAAWLYCWYSIKIPNQLINVCISSVTKSKNSNRTHFKSVTKLEIIKNEKTLKPGEFIFKLISKEREPKKCGGHSR